jgi:hypothetical protein
MTRPLVVWGAHMEGGGRRVVVATRTKKEAFNSMVLAGMPYNYAYWSLRACKTKNATEVTAALQTPGRAVVIPQ